jgi:hypothetical protein
MRHRIAAGFVVACVVSGALACVDLFHSTADVLDKCEIDAASCSLDFCALDAATTEGFAEHACAWLGACELPVGGNAFGPCMVEARLAFDCSINPSHPVIGSTHALWACLAQVQTCGDVRQCILPGRAPSCVEDAGATSCVSAGSGTARVACTDGGTSVENCALWGQTCDPSASAAVCGAGSAGGLACGPDGVPQDGAPGSCDSRRTEKVYWCGAAGEVGFDCSGSGMGHCGIFPSLDSGTSWPACLPEGDAACQATGSVSCAGDIATSCPAGLNETIDCARLLGTSGSCSDAGLAPPFDWTSPCLGSEACQDGCDGGTLIGCARGARFVTECAAVGLGGCHQVTTTGDDAGPHAACSPR